MARFIAKVSTGGRSHKSCCFCPMTSVMRRRKSKSRRRGSKPSTRTVPDVGWSRPDEHLERRGLAGAVGPEEADALAGGDGERQLVDGAHGRVAAVEQRAHRRPRAGGALVHAVLFDQLVDLDLRRHPGEPLNASKPNSKMSPVRRSILALPLLAACAAPVRRAPSVVRTERGGDGARGGG